ncbi:DNA polymerase zeta [Geranomyces michiganensis]|nr:DNA polymerase zeta [Geranomyces michiganensis]
MPPPPPPAALPTPFISIRIVSMDHYMAYPNRLLDHTATQFSQPSHATFRVPVVRIFGVTPHGQKACVHLHNAYRYFYIPYTGPPLADDNADLVRSYIHRLGCSINHATALAYGKDRDDAGKNIYIASIALVKGIPFYGVHPVYQPFLKVCILNPAHAKKIVTILQSGTVLGTCFQPYEVHLSYLHQLFIDYDLYGMDFIHLAHARFRLPILHVSRKATTTTNDHPTGDLVVENALDQRYKWPPNARGVERQSYCELELDAWVRDIMNRDRVKERPLVPLPRGSSTLDETIKLIPSLQVIWKDERERRDRCGITKPLSGDAGTQLSARDEYSPWSNEARLRAELDASIGRNKSSRSQHESSTSSSGIFDIQALEKLPTAFQSVPCWRPRPQRGVDEISSKAVADADVSADIEVAQEMTMSHESSFPFSDGQFSFSSQDYDAAAFANVPVVVDINRMTQALREEQEQQDNLSQAAVVASQDSESALLNLVESLERENGGGGVAPAPAATAGAVRQLSQTRRQQHQRRSQRQQGDREAHDLVLNDALGLSDAEISGGEEFADLSTPDDGFLNDLHLLYAEDDALDPGSPVSMPRSPATPSRPRSGAAKTGPGPSPLRQAFGPGAEPAYTPSRLRNTVSGPGQAMPPSLQTSPSLLHSKSRFDTTPKRTHSADQFDDAQSPSSLPARGQQVLLKMAQLARDHHMLDDNNDTPLPDTDLSDPDQDETTDSADPPSQEQQQPRSMPISARRFRLPQTDGAGDSPPPSPQPRFRTSDQISGLPPRAPPPCSDTQEEENEEEEEIDPPDSPPLIAGSTRKRRRRNLTFSSSPLLGTGAGGGTTTAAAAAAARPRDSAEVFYYRHVGHDRPPEFVKPSNSFECVAIESLKGSDMESGPRAGVAPAQATRRSGESTPDLISRNADREAAAAAIPLPTVAAAPQLWEKRTENAVAQTAAAPVVVVPIIDGTQMDLISQPRKRKRRRVVAEPPLAAELDNDKSLSPLLIEPAPRSDAALQPLSLPHIPHSPASTVASMDMFIPSEGTPPSLLFDDNRPGRVSNNEGDDNDDAAALDVLVGVLNECQGMAVDGGAVAHAQESSGGASHSNSNPLLIDEPGGERVFLSNAEPSSALLLSSSSSQWDEYVTEDVPLISLLDDATRGGGRDEGTHRGLHTESVMEAPTSCAEKEEKEEGRAASPASNPDDGSNSNGASQVSLVDSPSKDSSGVALFTHPARLEEIEMPTLPVGHRDPITPNVRLQKTGGDASDAKHIPTLGRPIVDSHAGSSPPSSPTPLRPNVRQVANLEHLRAPLHEQPHHHTMTIPESMHGPEQGSTAATLPTFHADWADLETEAQTPYGAILPQPKIVSGNSHAEWTFSARPPRVDVEVDAVNASVPKVPFLPLSATTLTELGVPSERRVVFAPTSDDSQGFVVPSLERNSKESNVLQPNALEALTSLSVGSVQACRSAAAAAAGGTSLTSLLIRPAQIPPTTDELLSTLKDFNIPRVVYREPFYSEAKDVPARAKTYAGREYKFQPTDPAFLPDFKPLLLAQREGFSRLGIKGLSHWRHVKFNQGLRTTIKVWRPGVSPPTRQAVEQWLKDHKPRAGAAALPPPPPREVAKNLAAAAPRDPDNFSSARQKPEKVSQLEAPTPKNAYGFKYDQISAKAVTQEKQFVSILSMELHAASQGDLLPNPQTDPIRCLFYCLKQDDQTRFPSNGHRPDYFVGVIMVSDEPLSKTGVTNCVFDSVPDEQSLIETFLILVREFDPDFLAGFEIHNASWGYLVERARFAHSMDLLAGLARVKPEVVNTKFGAEEDAWGSRKQSHLSATGRNFLNVWRLLRNEINLTSYTLESVAYHVLHIRIPKFSSRSLTEWYDGAPGESNTRMHFRWRTVSYYLARTQHVVSLIEDTETVSRTSEFARVFGIDFFSVLTRGSQYKVESIMARIAKPENYLLISPSGKQVFNQRACECLPLVMEPESRFYASPVLVLDFQSLYPSIMIAYNYCYSTCLGRVQNVGAPGKLGIMDDYEISAEFVEQYKDLINVSPNGVAFVKKEVRVGTLKRMLAEILDTRVMVKQSMKLYKEDKALLRILEARQLGLKFIANVTYGYTGASFSGRMPCAEIADAIVQTGRATLEKGIQIIHGSLKWGGARVVYGDTDSLFVHLPGANKDDAFRIGREIVTAITRTNPEPVKLKFEKVYHPCVLLAKKRYVGFKFESPDDVEPVFDAKGIETVRRDGCPAVVKSMEQCLKILFRSQDMSEVKRHCHRQWSKILAGRVSIQDFILAKEVNLGSYTVPPPGALVAMRKMASDPRAEPQIGERVPYVVVHGGPRYKLRDSVVPPEELLFSRNRLRLHGQYYIERMIIPAVSRIFNLVGGDLLSWYRDMPKTMAATRFTASQLLQEQQPPDGRGGPTTTTLVAGRTIDQYYVARHCVVCHTLVAGSEGRGGGGGGDDDGKGGGGTGADNADGDTTLCALCRADPPTTAATLTMRASAAQRAHAQIQSVCRSCTGHATALDADSACVSLDCPVFFARLKANDAARLAARWERSCSLLEW